MNPGARVRFKAHGETGSVFTLVTRDGDDVSLCYPNGRLLTQVPIELLEFVEPPGVDKPWREVDEIEAY